MNDFERQFRFLSIEDSSSILSGGYDAKKLGIVKEKRNDVHLERNEITPLKNIIFADLYRYCDFEIRPMGVLHSNSCFHDIFDEGIESLTRQFDSDFFLSKKRKVFNTYSLDVCCIPRLKRDTMLAWSIRKDFYKYWIKTEFKTIHDIINKLKILEENLPLDENMFFVFEDGVYICNLISDENLNKIKEHFGNDCLFVNDHELYFDLDKNTYKPQMNGILYERRKLTRRYEIVETQITNLTYCFTYFYFYEMLKETDFEVHKTSHTIVDVFIERDFLQKFDSKPLLKRISPGGSNYLFLWGLSHYLKFIDSEWKRIPIWYKKYITEKDLNIERTFDYWKGSLAAEEEE